MKLTEAQRRALVEIDAGRVIFDGMEQRYRSTAWPPAVRAPTIEAVLAAGFATTAGKTDPHDRLPSEVVLTDSGLAALQEARG